MVVGSNVVQRYTRLHVLLEPAQEVGNLKLGHAVLDGSRHGNRAWLARIRDTCRVLRNRLLDIDLSSLLIVHLRLLRYLRRHTLILDKVVIIEVVDGRDTRRQGTIIRRASGLAVRVRGSRRKGSAIEVLVDGCGAVGIVDRLRRGRRSRQGLGGRLNSELRARENAVPELRQRNSLIWVASEDPSQDVVQFVRQGENSLEEIRASRKGTVSGILKRSLLPGVATTGQVDQNDTKAPDIVGGAEVERPPG